MSLAFVSGVAPVLPVAAPQLRGSAAPKGSASGAVGGLLLGGVVGAAVAPKAVRRAFDPSAQVGVTKPLGFFDPAGFCKERR